MEFFKLIMFSCFAFPMNLLARSRGHTLHNKKFTQKTPLQEQNYNPKILEQQNIFVQISRNKYQEWEEKSVVYCKIAENISQKVAKSFQLEKADENQCFILEVITSETNIPTGTKILVQQKDIFPANDKIIINGLLFKGENRYILQRKTIISMLTPKANIAGKIYTTLFLSIGFYAMTVITYGILTLTLFPSILTIPLLTAGGAATTFFGNSIYALWKT